MAFRIKELRKNKRWTQDDLADKLGSSKSHVSEMEAGKKNPSTPMMEKLAEAFGVTVVDLFADPLEGAAKLDYIERYDRLDADRRKKLEEYVTLLLLQQSQEPDQGAQDS